MFQSWNSSWMSRPTVAPRGASPARIRGSSCPRGKVGVFSDEIQSRASPEAATFRVRPSPDARTESGRSRRPRERTSGGVQSNQPSCFIFETGRFVPLIEGKRAQRPSNCQGTIARTVTGCRRGRLVWHRRRRPDQEPKRNRRAMSRRPSRRRFPGKQPGPERRPQARLPVFPSSASAPRPAGWRRSRPSSPACPPTPIRAWPSSWCSTWPRTTRASSPT